MVPPWWVNALLNFENSTRSLRDRSSLLALFSRLFRPMAAALLGGGAAGPTRRASLGYQTRICATRFVGEAAQPGDSSVSFAPGGDFRGGFLREAPFPRHA